MQPRERRETGEQDLFRSRLDQIIDMKHPLATLGRTVDWSFLEREFGAVYTDAPGQPPLPTRLMAGLAILKHTYDLSDEVLCERWVENPYYQYFCGEEFFQHRLVFDRSSLTRWRNRMGEERLAALIQESLSVAARTKAIKPADLNRVIIDTTVQPKNVTFPTDAKLLNRAREKLVRLAQCHARDGVADQCLHDRDHGFQGVAVIWIAGQRLHVGNELAALAVLEGGGNADLDAELVRPMGLAFADAFDFRCMQGIDLRPALTLLLLAHAACQQQQPGERRFEPALALDLAADVAAEIGAQLPEHPVGALELFGMGIALMLDQGELAHP